MNIVTFLKNEIKIDRKLLKKLTKYRLIWANNNSSRITWLSSPHIGVEPVRFLAKEEEDFFDLVVGIDRSYLTKQIKDTKDIDETWSVGGNTFNILILSLMVMIKDDSKLKDKQKDQAFLDLFSIISYRFMTSMITNGFTYDLDKDLAESVFESMSRRFLIKRLGSWNALISYRAKDFQSGGIYNKRLKQASNEDIVKLIAAISTRLKDHFKEQYKVIEEIRENQEKRLSTSLAKTGEDGEYIMDMENLNREYFNYALAIVPIKSEFIDKDIVDIVANVYSRVDKKELLKVLGYMSDEYLNIKDIDKTINLDLKANIDYIYGTKLYPPYQNRILQVILHSRGLWSSSRVRDKNVLYVKKALTKIVKEVTGKNTEWLITPIVLCISMYIFIITVVNYGRAK